MQLVISIQKRAVLLKLATPNSLFFLEIYLVLMKIFRQLRLIEFLWRLTPMVLLWLYVLIDKLFFDRIGHTTGLLNIKFYCVYDKMFLSWSISFFFTSGVSLIMSCVRLLSELMILVSTQYVKKYLTCPTSWDSLSFVIWS